MAPHVTNDESLARQSIASITVMGCGMAVGMVITTVGRFVLAALLGAQVFGNVSISLTVVGFINLFANTMGDRYLVVTKRDRQEALNTVFTTELIVWIIVVVVWFCVSPLMWPSIGKGASWKISSILLLMGLAFPLSRPRALLEKSLKFGVIAIVNVTTNAVCMGIALLVALAFRNELALIVLALLSLLQAVVFMRISKIRPRFQVDVAILKEYIRLCWPLMLASFLVFIYWNGEKLLLDQFVTRESLGYYAWAFSLGMLVLRIKDVVARVLFPVFAKLIREGNEEHFRKGISCLYQTLTVLYGFLVPALLTLSPHLVALAGEEWLPAVPCVRIAVMIFTIRTFNSFLEPVFVAHGRPRVVMCLSAANCIFIMGFGYLALRCSPHVETMALVVLSSCIFTFAACAFLILRICRVDLFGIVVPGLLVSIVSGVTMHYVMTLMGGAVGIGVGVSAGLVVFGLYAWRKTLSCLAVVKGALATGRMSPDA